MMTLNYYSYCVGAKVIELDNLKHGFWLESGITHSRYWIKFMDSVHHNMDRSLDWVENLNVVLRPYNAHIVFFADNDMYYENDWEDSQAFVKFDTERDYAMFLLLWS